MTCRVHQASTYRNALCFVFLLLRLESQLNEELLQLLVAVVDAELLKAEGRWKNPQQCQEHKAGDRERTGSGTNSRAKRCKAGPWLGMRGRGQRRGAEHRHQQTDRQGLKVKD